MAIIGDLEAILTLNSSLFNAKLNEVVGKSKLASDAMGKNFSKLNAANLSKSLIGVGSAIDALSVGIIASTAGIAAHFETMTQHIAGNTNMTSDQLDFMRKTILSLGDQSGASFDQLGQGFMHITNLGFDGADAVKILNEAMQSAIATGSNVGDVANALAMVMKDFSISALDAADTMNILHSAAADGNMTLEEMVTAFGQTAGEAGNLGLHLDDVAAAMSALTRHGVDASEAGTQLKNMLLKLVVHTPATTAAMSALSKITGVDLVGDLTEAGLKAKGLHGVLEDVAKATHGNIAEMMKYTTGVSLSKKEINQLTLAQSGNLAALKELDPNMRGLYGMFVLTNNGAKDYTNTLNDIKKSEADNTVNKEYQAALNTMGQQMDLVKNKLETLAITLGNKFEPIILKVAKSISGAIDSFTKWSAAHTDLIAKVLLIAAAVGGFITFIGIAILLVGVIAAAFSQLGLAILAIIAVVTLLGTTWMNNWGNIQKYLKIAWDVISSVFNSLVKVVTTTVVPIFKDIIKVVKENKTQFETLAKVIGGIVLIAIITIMAIIAGLIILIAGIADVIIHVIGWIIQFIGWVGNVGNHITGLKNNVVQAFNTISTTISDAIAGLIKSAYTWGSNIVRGIAKGITDGVSGIKRAIGGVASIIADHFPQSPAKTGPLSRINKMMPAMMNMFIKDIHRMAPQLTGALNAGLSGAGNVNWSSYANSAMPSLGGAGNSTSNSVDNHVVNQQQYVINTSGGAGQGAWQTGRDIQQALENLASNALYIG